MDIEASKRPLEKPVSRKLTTIVATDICGYSKLSEKSDQKAIKLVDAVFFIFENSVQKHQGRVFKRIADGFLAEFPSAESAMRSAVEFTQAIKEQSYSLTTSKEIGVRTGIHVGDVTERSDGDLLGHGVNVAVRLQERANIGSVLASANVINLLRQSSPFFKKVRRGPLSLKNIKNPVVAFDVYPLNDSLSFNQFFTKQKWIKNTVIIGSALAVVLALSFNYRTSRALDATKTIDAIMDQNFIATASTDAVPVSSAYIRNVLENLKESNLPSQKAVFALLEKNNVSAAVESLIAASEGDKHGTRRNVKIMHQIAALSYHNRPTRAAAYYEYILEINPNDKIAGLWLFRAYNLIGDSDAAQDIYNRVKSRRDGTPKENLRLIMDMAFNQMLSTDFQAGADLLMTIQAEVNGLGDQRLLLEWQTSLALALERLGRINEAEPLLISTLSVLNAIGPDTNTPRAYNILGQIEEKKATANSNDADKHLMAAINYYSEQYKYGVQLKKPSDISESLHYLGDVYIRQGEIASAKEHHTKSLLVSRENNFIPPEYRSRIGLAHIALFENKPKNACQHLKRISHIKAGRNPIYISPLVEKRLKKVMQDLSSHHC